MKLAMPNPTAAVVAVVIALAVALYARFPGYQRYQLTREGYSNSSGEGYHMMRLDTVTGDIDVCVHRPNAGDLNGPPFKMVCYHQ